MPQLDLYSYSSLVCWLLVVFTLVYFITLRYALPTLYKILLIRQVKLTSLNLEINYFTKELVLLIELYTTVLVDLFDGLKETLRVFTLALLDLQTNVTQFDLLDELDLVSRASLLLKVSSTSLVETFSLSKKLY